MLLFLLALDLTHAVVVTPPDPAPLEKKAAQILVEEVEKRTRVRWEVAAAAPAAAPAIVLERGHGPAEGYRLRSRGARIAVSGNDGRGVLYGAGRLLRQLRLERDRVILEGELDLSSAPRVKLRGHQLGYRPKTNSYDGWTVAMWDQYMRDLAAFGANAVELIPPRSDDAADSPHFPAPPMEMMAEMSRLAGSYGLDVWIWYPALDRDYTDPATVERALAEWGAVFGRLPRVDAVMVPGGDPGHTQPKVLMALLEKQAANLRKYHPRAQIWVSPQGFSQEWLEEFITLLRAGPEWLSGVVHGPQVRVSIQELRRLVPARYPIRNYPDITHSLHCQFAVPDWDLAHALAHAREPINPRPEDMRVILRHDLAAAVGFITYSEGCNDDVNKIVWSALGWDPDADLVDVLRQYGRYFVGWDFAEGVAQGLLALERNWRGPLLANPAVETTLAQFQEMERRATPRQKLEWRWQQMLYRAYYDALNRRRLIWAQAQEQRALSALEAAAHTGTAAALERASRILNEEEPRSDLRQRIFALAEALYQSARMQLSVPLYQAISRDRGASLDNIGAEMNNRGWLLERFSAIRKMESEPERLQAVREILNWTNPGPGGFYDDLGNPAAQPHLVQPVPYAEDPANLRTPRNGFALHSRPVGGLRLSWVDHAEVMYDGPLELHYTGLDPQARYKVRIVYGGEQNAARIQRLIANLRYEIHPFRKIEARFEPVEFAIPREATAGGELRLRWERQPGLPGNGRSNQVAEVWLIRENAGQ